MIKNDLPKTELMTKDFDYFLPDEPRDSSRLMVLDRKEKSITHRHFYDIIDFLNEGDVLVINDSRVIPARIYGEKIREEGDFVLEPAKIETLLLRQRET